MEILRKPQMQWAWLGLIFAAHLALNAVWASRDQTLRGFDMGPYLYGTLHLYSYVASEGLAGIYWILRSQEGAIWTGGVFLPWLALAALFGHSVEALRLYNLCYVALLLLSVHLLGRRLHSARAGLLAAALVSLYPLIYGEARQLGADIPGTAMTTLSMALLLGTERFRRPWRSLLLGLAVGATVMVKPQAAFFVGLPAALLLGVALVRPQQTGRGRILLSAGLCALGAAAVSSFWWLGRLTAIFKLLVWHAEATENIHPGMEPSAMFYLRMLPAAVTPFGLLVLAVALYALLGVLRRSPRWHWLYHPRMLLVWAWLAGGYAFLSFTRVRYMRYMLPLIPALAVLTAVGLLSLRHRGRRRVLVGMALAVATVTWVVDSQWINAVVRWGYDDDPASTIPRAHYISSGPPATTSLYPAALELGDFLRKRHSSGGDLILKFRYAPANVCQYCNRFYWVMGPLVVSRLPGINVQEPLYEVQGTTYKEIPTSFDCNEIQGDRYFLQAGRSYLPTVARKHRHLYLLKLDDGYGSVADPPPPAKPVYQKTIRDPTARDGRTVLTLWHKQICK